MADSFVLDHFGQNSVKAATKKDKETNETLEICFIDIHDRKW